MGTCKITSPNSNVDGSVCLDVVTTPLYVNRRQNSPDFPEMYNYNGEELLIAEMPYGALLTDAVERAANKARIVFTLVKMEKNIAAGGKSYKVNPIFSIDTSQVESFSMKIKGGKTMTLIPQADQYHFYSNRGMTRALGLLEKIGSGLDFFSILKMGMNPDKKEMLPIPGALGTLTLPMKDYLRDLDEMVDGGAQKELEKAKRANIQELKKAVETRLQSERGYNLLEVSNEVAKHIMDGKIKTEEDLITAHYNSEPHTCQVLYRIIEDKRGYDVAVIETFFFQID